MQFNRLKKKLIDKTVHKNEIKELEQQIREAIMQNELNKCTRYIIALSEESRESEKKWTSQIEQLEIQLGREKMS